MIKRQNSHVDRKAPAGVLTIDSLVRLNDVMGSDRSRARELYELRPNSFYL